MGWKVTVDVNTAIANAKIDGLEKHIQPAMRAALNAVTNAVRDSTEAAMQRLIYDQPLPESMASRGQVRTGALKAGESIAVVDANTRVIKTQNNGFVGKRPVEYAHVRHAHKNLPAPWRIEGLKDVDGKLDEIASDAFHRTLALRRNF